MLKESCTGCQICIKGAGQMLGQMQAVHAPSSVIWELRVRVAIAPRPAGALRAFLTCGTRLLTHPVSCMQIFFRASLICCRPTSCMAKGQHVQQCRINLRL